MRIIDLCLLSLSLQLSADAAAIQECDFKPQCTCTESMVTCVGTRIFSLRDVFGRSTYLRDDERVFSQIVVSRSGLLQIDWAPKHIVTLSLPKNSIYEIHPRALTDSAETLSSFDLSDNALSDFPNLGTMRQLRWLNLQRNQFSEVPLYLRETNLTTLLLSGNFIRAVTANQFPATLTSLHLESNQILSVEGHSVPAGVQLLNLGNNFIRAAPHNFHRCSSLQRLILSGNVIQRLPSQWRLPNTFEDLDLSRGSLREIHATSLGLTNGSSLNLKSLHLEFNYITSLSKEAFQGVHLRKLFLNSNRLMQLPDGLFDGAIAATLLVLDLSENRFEVLPDCVVYLQSLSALVVKGNQLASFEYHRQIPKFIVTLQMLDLAYNKLTEIPTMLSNMSSLTRLNLQGNYIESLTLLSKGRWGSRLRSLILSNNAIRTVSFRDFSKVIALKELKLSFNNVRYLDSSSFETLKDLQALEMSSSLAHDFRMNRLSKLLDPLRQLRSLHVDYDRIHGADILAPNLINVDFDGNDLIAIPLIPSNSEAVRLSFSYNGISNLKKNSFQNISSLEQVILIGNPLREIEVEAFSELGSLVSVILSSNRIRKIHRSSFRDLPSLQRVHLDNNLLTHLNLDMFSAAGRRLLLNASTNAIKTISAANDPVDTRIVDLSYNELTSLTTSFWESTRGLVQLFASRNEISQLLPGKTPHRKLSVVDLSWNRLTADAVSNLSLIAPFLEELYLKANNLESIASPENVALDRLKNWKLRILDVSTNLIRALSGKVLPSALQMLNLSGNPLQAFDSSELSQKLVSLDVSETHLGLEGIPDLEQLQMLNVSSTRTEHLSGKALPKSLLVLEAAGCELKSISLDSPMLIALNLRNVSLPPRITVNASRLRRLSLAHNAIRNLTALLRAFSSERLRTLAAEHNSIDKISPELWKQTPFLHTLDMSSNPVDVLGAHSFRGLWHLADLDMRNLSLDHLDSRVLKEVPCLSTLRISTYNRGIRSLRLQELLAESQLRRAVVEVGEPVLSYQLQWAFTDRAKLRELHVTGAPLRLILPDAFQGLESVHELSLRITHTSIAELPPGLLRYLTDVRYLSLDLRYNQLQSLSPTVLDSRPLLSAQRDTQLLPGGLRVDGNPWRCSCDLAWLASWLRRWIRETGRLQRFEASTALQLHQAVRRATCYLPNGRSIPIVEFSFEEIQCAMTGASTNSAYHTPPTMASCVAIFMSVYILVT